MNIFKYIVIGILAGIFNMYPISYYNQFFLCQELFNTSIFYDNDYISLLNLGMLISIILIYRTDIIKFMNGLTKGMIRKKGSKGLKNNKNYFKYVKCLLITSFVNLFISIMFNFRISNINHLAYYFVITIIFLIFTKEKNGIKKYYEITYIDALLVGMSSIFSIIPTIPILLCNLFCCLKQKMTKKTSLRYSLTCLIPVLFVRSIPGIISIFNDSTYILEKLIGFIASIFISCGVYKSLKYMVYTNKLHRLAFLLLFLVIFIFYWFI